MPAQEFYVEGIIQINITIFKSWWKVLFVSGTEIPAKRVCPYTFKVPGLHGFPRNFNLSFDLEGIL